jgi:hypothetical protein
VDQIFSAVIIKISNCFSMLVMALFCHILDIELANSALTALSFGFVVPGLIVIIIGESLLENNDININLVLYRPQEKRASLDEIEMR